MRETEREREKRKEGGLRRKDRELVDTWAKTR